MRNPTDKHIRTARRVLDKKCPDPAGSEACRRPIAHDPIPRYPTLKYPNSQRPNAKTPTPNTQYPDAQISKCQTLKYPTPKRQNAKTPSTQHTTAPTHAPNGSLPVTAQYLATDPPFGRDQSDPKYREISKNPSLPRPNRVLPCGTISTRPKQVGKKAHGGGYP